MKLSATFFTLFMAGIIFSGCSKDKADTGNNGNSKPQPGTSKTVTKEIEYYSGQIENTTSWATWPIAKFAVDDNAVKYSVKVLKTSSVYTWKKSEETKCEYHVFPSLNDIKGGYFYIGVGRTWCSGCSAPNPVWLDNYKAYFGTDTKVEITFYY
jgi:hypothetical protein